MPNLLAESLSKPQQIFLTWTTNWKQISSQIFTSTEPQLQPLVPTSAVLNLLISQSWQILIGIWLSWVEFVYLCSWNYCWWFYEWQSIKHLLVYQLISLHPHIEVSNYGKWSLKPLVMLNVILRVHALNFSFICPLMFGSRTWVLLSFSPLCHPQIFRENVSCFLIL